MFWRRSKKTSWPSGTSSSNEAAGAASSGRLDDDQRRALKLLAAGERLNGLTVTGADEAPALRFADSGFEISLESVNALVAGDLVEIHRQGHPADRSTWWYELTESGRGAVESD